MVRVLQHQRLPSVSSTPSSSEQVYENINPRGGSTRNIRIERASLDLGYSSYGHDLSPDSGVRRSYTATVSVSSPVAIPEPMDSRPRPDVSVTCDDADGAASGDSDCSSFEMLLPDFSSLAIGDTLAKDEPVYSKVQKGRSDKNQTTESKINNLSDLEDVVALLLKENRRLQECLNESNEYIRGVNLQAKADAKAGVVTAPGDANGQETKDQKENKKDKKSSKKSVSGKNGVDSCNVSILNLSEQLNVAEEAQAQLSQDLQRVTQEKLEIQNQLASLNLEFENMKTSSDQLGQEKWELTQVNNDLQQRLQQTVALARMQAEGNQNRLQEEFQRMMFQLEEERKVTENLSKSLELEKRKVESLEQRAKHNGSSRGSREAENSKRRSSLLPDNVKDAETRLGQSMETYRQRCDNLGNSLHGLLNKLEDERYFGDLATEVNKLRKLLSDEKKKVGGERHKLGEVHAMFETIYDEYSRTVDSLDAAQREIQHKVQQQKQQAVLTSIAKTNIQDNVDSMTVRLMAAEEELAQERRDHAGTRERLHHAALELESLPLLQAQVEVYQSDFNAEREARERIAGEKADLEEQLRKAGVHKAQPTAPPPTLGRPRQESQERGGGGYGQQQHHNGGGQYNGRADGLYHGGGGGRYNGDGNMAGGGWRNNNETHRGPMFNNNAVRDRVNNVNNVDAQFENLPATIPTNRPEHGNGKDPEESFTCPKCNREFRNTTLLTRHVNDCLDRDY